MSLNQLPAKDSYRREVRTEWGGINLNENAGDGELIEAVNMSSREYPLLATARPFVKRQADYWSVQNDIFAPYVYAGELGFEYADNSPHGLGIYLWDPTRPGSQSNCPVVDNSSGMAATKQYAIMGTRMCMFGGNAEGYPQHKRIYDFSTGEVTSTGMVPSMESTFSLGNVDVVFTRGTIGGVPAQGNTIYCAGVNWGDYFSVGDAVTISGCVNESNNKTPIIREIDGPYLRFSENTFVGEIVPVLYWDAQADYSVGTTFGFTHNGASYLWETDVDIPKGTRLGLNTNSMAVYFDVGDTRYTYVTQQGSYGPGAVVQTFASNHFTISRTVPDLDFVCVNENRMWGCKGDTIYASKLGDPLNWNVYDGLSTDSWTAETGTQGDFTGCCSYQGYPTFFKDNAVFKVLGDEPKNFTLRKQNIMGVKSGGDKTIVEIRGKLYYLSHAGVMEWNGGDYPTIISGALGIDPGMVSDAGSTGAGTDTVRYYIQLGPMVYTGNEYVPWSSRYSVYVYDTRYGTWHMIPVDPIYKAAEFAGDGTHNWMLKDHDDETGTYFIYNLSSYDLYPDTETDWRVTFADSTRAYKTALTGSESKKGVLRLLIRCRLAGSMKVWIAYDGGEFEQAAEFSEMAKTSKVVPLILRRCDFWQLRLTGKGDAVIYSIAVEKYGGEWQQA